MMKKLFVLSVVWFIAICLQCEAQATYDVDFIQIRNQKTLLQKLDKALDQRKLFIDARQREIDGLKQQLAHTSSPDERLALYSALYNQYVSYRTDSAFVYADLAYRLAKTEGTESDQQHTSIDLAYCYCLSGLYHEGNDLMPRRDKVLPDVLLNYYIAQCSFLQWQSEFTTIPRLKQELHDQSMAYHDSILLTDPNPLHQLQEKVQIPGYMSRSEALKRLVSTIDSLPSSEDYIRYMALMTGQIFQEEQQTDSAIVYYAISAISDMQHGVLEHASLQRVATLLFEEGDFKHAYSYMDCCLKDARQCGARLRTMELQENLDLIMSSYNNQLLHQHGKLQIVLIIVVGLLLLVVLVGLQLNRARKHLKRNSKQLMMTNEQLKKSHLQLEVAMEQVHQTNESLEAANRSLLESNRIKDSFVTQYMKQCRAGIAQLQSYQQMLQRLVTTRSMDRLLETIKSGISLDEELDTFYNNFDDTFLSLYPNFVEELNAMIPLEERYPLPVATATSRGTLPTELRVFALMRLGVTDLDEIASFLRCAPKTVLNYRSRLRQRATIDKEQLDRWIVTGRNEAQ